MRRYIALIHEGRAGFGVSFPDFPGCIAVERTIDDALASAANALRFHVEGLVADGLSVSKPRKLSEIRNDSGLTEDVDGAVVASAPPLLPRRRPQRRARSARSLM